MVVAFAPCGFCFYRVGKDDSSGEEGGIGDKKKKR